MAQSRAQVSPARPLRLVTSGDYVSEMDLGGFEAWLRSWSAADRTIADRVIVIRAGLREWGDPRQATPDTLTQWLSNPRLSPWSRVTYFHHARSYFGWLHQTGQIEVNPAAELRVPKSPKDKPRPLTKAEVDLVLTAATGHLRAYLMLGLLAGLRVHEIAKFRGEDINAESIFVLGKGRQQAFIPTHPDLWVLAQEYPRRGWWFASTRSDVGHVLGTSISTMVTKHFSAFGVEGSIHRTRHTFATNLLRSGVNVRVVQELMRHQSLATTARYCAVDEDERMLAIAGLLVA